MLRVLARAGGAGGDLFVAALDDERRDRDELACRGGAYEGVKDLVIAEH